MYYTGIGACATPADIFNLGRDGDLELLRGWYRERKISEEVK